MKKLILIKLGGSLITDKNKVNTPRTDVIKDLANQIKDVIRSNQIELDKIRKIPITSNYIRLHPILSSQIIIATGAGGFGHPVAKKYQNNLREGLPYIKKAVKEINQIVVNSLIKVGIKAVSVEPSKIAEYKNGKMISLFHGSIVSLLENNIVPVFHADLVEDKRLDLSILSMDRFLVDVAIQLKNSSCDVEKVIFCGTTDGVLDNQGKTIDKIDNENFHKLDKYFYENNQVDMSGGMKGKVLECLRLIDEKISCQIINGQKENNLSKAILDRVVKGTSILR